MGSGRMARGMAMVSKNLLTVLAMRESGEKICGVAMVSRNIPMGIDILGISPFSQLHQLQERRVL
jgi:hypothetical protein